MHSDRRPVAARSASGNAARRVVGRRLGFFARAAYDYTRKLVSKEKKEREEQQNRARTHKSMLQGLRRLRERAAYKEELGEEGGNLLYKAEQAERRQKSRAKRKQKKQKQKQKKMKMRMMKKRAKKKKPRKQPGQKEP